MLPTIMSRGPIDLWTKDAPFHRAIQRLGAITSQPVLGGLHHQYCRIFTHNVARPPVLIGGPPHAATSYNMHLCDAPAPAAGRPHKPIPLASPRSDRSCAGSTTDARWR